MHHPTGSPFDHLLARVLGLDPALRPQTVADLLALAAYAEERGNAGLGAVLRALADYVDDPTSVARDALLRTLHRFHPHVLHRVLPGVLFRWSERAGQLSAGTRDLLGAWSTVVGDVDALADGNGSELVVGNATMTGRDPETGEPWTLNVLHVEEVREPCPVPSRDEMIAHGIHVGGGVGRASDVTLRTHGIARDDDGVWRPAEPA